jgi:hypothetical protein
MNLDGLIRRRVAIIEPNEEFVRDIDVAAE